METGLVEPVMDVHERPDDLDAVVAAMETGLVEPVMVVTITRHSLVHSGCCNGDRLG